jgi:hypothetical protein
MRSTMRSKGIQDRGIVSISLWLPLALSVLSLSLTTCSRAVRVRKEMTWECVPQEYNPTYHARPDEYARFRFLENPHCFEVESSKNFCAQLQKAGRSIVDADFEIWGNGQNVRGYRMLAVDGRPIEDVGGWGNSGANDYAGPSPIDDAFRSH